MPIAYLNHIFIGPLKVTNKTHMAIVQLNWKKLTLKNKGTKKKYDNLVVMFELDLH
jgi:hypothetical protein